MFPYPDPKGTDMLDSATASLIPAGPGAPITPPIAAAPWTADEIERLTWHQQAGLVHPFTCGRRSEHPEIDGVLVATRDGWRCPADDCGYTQTWAHPFMIEPPTPDMLAHAHRLTYMRTRAATHLWPCLHHGDFHTGLTGDCFRVWAAWIAKHPHLRGRASRDAYAHEVEQRILDQIVRDHAPALA